MQSIQLCRRAVQIECLTRPLAKAVSEFCQRFPVATHNDIFATLSIGEDRLVFDYGTYARTVSCAIKARDLYPTILSFYYTAALHANLVPVHSVAIGRERESTLIVGDFGVGKTKLALSSMSRGFEMYSGDHTLLRCHAAGISTVQGTKQVTFDGSRALLDNRTVLLETEVKKITVVVGACDQGIISEARIEEPLAKARKIASHIVWPYFTPLSTATLATLLDPAAIEMAIAAAHRIGAAVVPLVCMRGDVGRYVNDLLR